jgi:hypothetical protein
MIQYFIGRHECAPNTMALIDCGANGCVCCDDILVLEGSVQLVDVSGLCGHCKIQLQIVTSQALIEIHKGNVIALFHQIVLIVKDKSILSCLQMEDFSSEISRFAKDLDLYLSDTSCLP